MKKKLISMLLVSCMLLTSAPMTALAAEVEFSDSADDYEESDEFVAEFTEMQGEPEADFEMGEAAELFSDEGVAEAFVSEETAEAAQAEISPEIYVCGTKVTPENQADILGNQTVSYNSETNTITLNEAHLTGRIVSSGDLNIELSEGSDNSIVYDGTSDGILVDDGLHAGESVLYAGNWNDVTISGAGHLSICGPKHAIAVWEKNMDPNFPNNISIDGNVSINDGAKLSFSTPEDAGGYTNDFRNDGYIIAEVLQIEDAEVKLSGMKDGRSGLAARIKTEIINSTITGQIGGTVLGACEITVLGSKLELESRAPEYEYAIAATGNVEKGTGLIIENSIVNIKSNPYVISSSGIIDIKSSTVNVETDDTEKYSGYGIYGHALKIEESSTVSVKGNVSGLCSIGEASIAASIVDVETDADVGNGIYGKTLKIEASIVDVETDADAGYGIYSEKLKIEDSSVTSYAKGYPAIGYDSQSGVLQIDGNSTVTASTAGNYYAMLKPTSVDQALKAIIGKSKETAEFLENPVMDWSGNPKYVKIGVPVEITVVSGKASDGTKDLTNAAVEGMTVTIMADPDPAGQVFKGWKVDSGEITLENSGSTTTTFTMPSMAVSVTAEYEDAANAISVENGTANAAEAKAGETITITANPAPYDYSFYKWEVVSGDITLANQWSRTTTFTMPVSDVSVKATYYYAPYIPPTPSPTPTPDPIPDNYPEGSERNPDGSITTPNGTEVDKDGTITLPDGTELKPDEEGNKPTIDKDNNVTDTNGTVIDKDGNITLPGKDSESATDDTKVETGTGSKPPKYDPETGNVTTEDGNKVTLPGGQEITPPAGSIVEKDGTITESDGTIVAPDGTITKPDGTVIDPDGTIHNTDGSIQSSDGIYLRPATPMLESAEIGVSGNQVKAILSGECAGAEGYDYVISENINCIVDKDYLARSRNILKTDTAFYYIPAGTYYVYCHAYTRDENGKKVFSEWSNYRMVTVTAITPEIPEITDVRVKGRNVIVTYTNCENADGYDIILGRAYKSVNGEKRPVDYIPYVQKIKNGNTTTAIFRNVPKGRYFAGLHAWNRTSEDGKKVFSPWSKSRRVIVK